MALFVDKDFEKMAIPVMEKDLLSNPTVIQIFGKLPKSALAVIRYIALMYDHKSPIRTKISDIVERKNECAEVADVTEDKERLFDLSDQKYIGYINAYLRHQSSKIWAILAANEEVLWQYQEELLKPITDFKNDKDKLQALEMKSKLMSECDAIIRRIESYEDKLFSDNLEKKDDIINFTPESIADL